MSIQSGARTKEPLRIAVVGTGYVGLVTGACLADIGHQVTCVDKSPERVAAVNRGTAPFHEPGLPEMLSRCIQSGQLRASTNTAEAVSQSDVTFIAVGTPSNQNGIDLSYLATAAEEIGHGIKASHGYHVVVVKSTVVPGTTDTLVRNIIERVSGFKAGSFGLCMNPEFLREGSAVADFGDSDRIIIGQWDAKSGERLAEVYSLFDCPKIFTSLRNAELTKYASNALLATLISFSNELAGICEATPESDIEEVLSGLYFDRRFMSTDGKPPQILSYLRAGSGYGGSCLPKDVLALRQYAGQQDVRTNLLDAVAEVNRTRPQQVISLAEQACGSLRGRTVAVLGLAFKPGTDDVRDSPSLAMIASLRQKGATVRAYDPIVSALPNVDDLTICKSGQEALAGADVAVLVTAWPEFAQYDWAKLCSLMRTPILVDGRNVLAGVCLPESAVRVPIGRHFERQGASVGK